MKTVALLHWAPRILGILAILFISMFSLDAFAPGLSLKEQILGWLIHMIPSWILIALLIIAWKWEKIGGIIFISLGLAFAPVLFSGNYMNNHSVWMSIVIAATLTLPIIITGLLFMFSFYTKQKAAEVMKHLKKEG
jgi:hypothetical protein